LSSTKKRKRREKIKRYLNELEKSGNIVQQNSEVTTLITVVKYDEWQLGGAASSTTNEQQTGSKRAANGTHTKKVKNDKKEKNVKNITKVVEVVNYFNEKTGQTLKMTTRKKQQILARLKVFSLIEIKESIDIRLADSWYMGENETGKCWAYDWDSLFRNDEKIDKLLNRNKSPRKQSLSIEEIRQKMLNS